MSDKKGLNSLFYCKINRR